MDYVSEMKDLKKKHDFFVGIDSDGCVFDTMEIKQKECFCPAFIKRFGLQPASRFAREVWEFVNLYSKSRGCNRFLAVQQSFKLMAERPIFAERGLNIVPQPALDAWLKEESKLGNPTLAAKVRATHDPFLTQLLAWSVEVNERIKDLVFGVPPFSKVRACLEKMNPRADIIVVSQTPLEALRREWEEHHMLGYLDYIAGQEAGTKSEHLEYASKGKYPADKILMIGDAPGDLKAAKANACLFFPVIPGDEERSWKRLHDEALDKFFAGTYAGAYQAALLKEFDAALPEKPHWKD